jgi:hypothetical protein
MSTFDYSGVAPEDIPELKLIAKRVKGHLPKVVPIIIAIGEELENAKKRVPHGQFAAYCLDECGLDIRSAENYMNLAKLARVYDPNDIAKINLNVSYKLGASTAPDVVSDVMAEVRAGRRISEDEVKRRLSVAKGAVQSGPSPAPDVGEIADLLIGALDRSGVGEVERFLRFAKQPLIKALCGRLQQVQKGAPTNVSDRLPRNSFA